MNFVSRQLSTALFRRPNTITIGSLSGSSSLWWGPSSSVVGPHYQHHQLQASRGIRVRVLNGNLEQALAVMTRKMVSSGIERLIRRQQRHHIKNSEKRVLARKRLEHRIRSQDLARKLRSILIKKVRSMRSYQQF
ncbi:uncharacterized protein LOC131258123 isoform X2 [Magnolia sinica]|uniref:uncharacterized protein LOC131258123 isoform X2 n=1 Tax=Magnolia sinica TaxID=86752 RepID=UPI00265B3FD2|nr:uncharacterized protein LOC131258123 isoform X2 [Magnolia sinica]